MAEFAGSRPGTPDEPSDAGFDLTAAWRAGSWLWTVGHEMPEVDDEPTGFREWSAADPAQALRAAWEARDTWYALPPEG